MRDFCSCLMGASPTRPGDDGSWLGAPLRKALRDAADFLN
jgi:hypothetical protein